ncbi:hypothetical protein DFQ26_008499 [Actinomortierella ambigua]|nr:hypothetical protein DFQ26_008499 [Actinomortierella ambigua]
MLTTTAAQQTTVAPLPATNAGYARHKDKFYIYGGRTNITDLTPAVYSGQFFALELSKLWTAASPAWIQLPPGPAVADAPVVVSADGKVLMSFPGMDKSAYRYQFETKTWTTSTNAWVTPRRDLSPVVLQTDGTVLILGGDGASPSSDTFGIYTFDTDRVISSSPIEPYGAGDDGTLFLSYGGYNDLTFLQPYRSTLYILDLSSGVWTAGADSNQGRGFAACTITGDYFLVWGGKQTGL